MRNKLILLLISFFIFSAFKTDRVITVFMIGDSTMANKSLDGGNPERGWGHVLAGFFTEDVLVNNHAVNGRSSKSFIDEGRWKKVISQVKKGDFVFIQFGHNNEKTGSTRHTDPGTTFDANLRRFVNETRAKGGIPVLFNSIVRRNFIRPQNKDMNITDNGYLVVSNSLSPLNNSGGNGIGLRNLNERCVLLTGKSVKITKEADLFVVKVPLNN